MNRIFKYRVSAALFAALSVSAGAAAAQTTAAAPVMHPVMRLGEQTHAPAGFLDMCRRTPQECVAEEIAPTRMADVSRDFGRAYWRAIFGRPVEAPAAAMPDAPVSMGRSSASQPRPHANWMQRSTDPVVLAAPVVTTDKTSDSEVLVPAAPTAFHHSVGFANAGTSGLMILSWRPVQPVAETVVTAAPATELQAEADGFLPVDAVSEPKALARISLSKAVWGDLNEINRGWNRAIRHLDDNRQFDKNDYWAIPTGQVLRGDCEDYVLTKRRALITAGYPQEALSIALVRTRWGELHAVLLVATDEGEMVMDNLSPSISRWDAVDYDWLERQVGGDAMDWRTVVKA